EAGQVAEPGRCAGGSIEGTARARTGVLCRTLSRVSNCRCQNSALAASRERPDCHAREHHDFRAEATRGPRFSVVIFDGRNTRKTSSSSDPVFLVARLEFHSGDKYLSNRAGRAFAWRRCRSPDVRARSRQQSEMVPRYPARVRTAQRRVVACALVPLHRLQEINPAARGLTELATKPHLAVN